MAERGKAVAIGIDEASDTISGRVAADLGPLFPDFGLALGHTVAGGGEAQVRMWAWAACGCTAQQGLEQHDG